MPLEQIIESIIAGSYEAGKAIMDIYHQSDRGEQLKADESPLTMADLASNKILCDLLKKITPDIPIISEENEHLPYEERKTWTDCWMVDPLDGTKEFIKRNGEFTTNVALIRAGQPIAGVVYAPALDLMYYAIQGKGAYQRIDGQDHRLQVASFRTSQEGLRIVCSRSHINEATQDYIDQFTHPLLVATGSSLKIMKLAAGEAEVYPRLGPTMEWDIAAAQAILEEAGGSVLQHKNGQPLVYNKENLLNPHFIAQGEVIQ